MERIPNKQVDCQGQMKTDFPRTKWNYTKHLARELN